jgi:hypothetical protein
MKARWNYSTRLRSGNGGKALMALPPKLFRRTFEI